MSVDPAWRAATLDDLPGIEALARRWDEGYGTLETTVVDSLRYELERRGERALSCVVPDGARVVAAGWMRRIAAGSGHRDLLYALADPQRPELYAGVLRWLVDRCPPPAPGDVQRVERMLAPATPELPASVTALYESLAYALKYIEHEVACDLHSMPRHAAVQVDGITIAPWSADRHEAIGLAYNEAFRDRGVAAYAPAEWLSSFPPGEVDTRASYIALDGDRIVGFVLAIDPDLYSGWVDPATRDCGWIGNVGVGPAHRERGIATALVTASMRAYRDAGMARVALRVNDDNDRARRVYERLGFVPARKHVVYERRG